jgi:hypothetical protein
MSRGWHAVLPTKTRTRELHAFIRSSESLREHGLLRLQPASPSSLSLLLRTIHPTSSLSLTSHPPAFPGVLHDHIKSRIGEPSCPTYLYSTFSFRLGVYDSQIPFGLQPIPSPSVGSSTLSKTPRTTP